ncbi:DUF6053 domain-containing protein [Lysobacter enzymogenes]
MGGPSGSMLWAQVAASHRKERRRG